MTMVRVPPVLRQQTGGAREVEAEGNTVDEVLRDLVQKHPALGGQLYQDGRLQPFVNVYVNDEDVKFLKQLETPVGPQDTVIILPAMAGGA